MRQLLELLEKINIFEIKKKMEGITFVENFIENPSELFENLKVNVNGMIE
jgi:hypothetical protein